MLQDIAPHCLSIAYEPRSCQTGDYLIYIHDNKILTVNDANSGEPALPQYGKGLFSDIGIGKAQQGPPEESRMQFLLSADETAFFLVREDAPVSEEITWSADLIFRTMQPEWIAFAGITAFHLAKWYDHRRYCGRCQTRLEPLANERALQCPACKATEYPKISPVVIVGIIDGDQILLSRYAAGAYKRHALIAGFVEIGETLEDAVRREVMEEVGLEVHNIRYYNSQPWGFSESLLAGFFAEADSGQPLSLDLNELSEAGWYHRDAIPRDGNPMSLTWTMIEAFRNGLV